jgi:excisionase family DNA binding protein
MKDISVEPKSRLLTKIQMAAVLGVTPRTVEHYMNQGTVPYLRLGSRTVRFDLDMVMAQLKGGN